MAAWISVFTALVCCIGGAIADEAPSRIVYEPTWASLDRHATPAWLMDAKLGVFIYAPPPTAAQWDAWQARHGLPPKPFTSDYSMDKVDWDVDQVVQDAVDAGARYIVVAGDERSYFLMWPSRHADVEGSKFTTLGPDGRDWLGEIMQKARARGLRVGIYRNYLHPGRYPFFLKTMYEMIDRYQPDTLWLDESKFSYPTEVLKGRELLAYYYNHSEKQAEVACEDALGSYKQPTIGKKLVHGDWYRKEMAPRHDEISDGYFVRYEPIYRWRSRAPRDVGSRSGIVNNTVEWLVDAAAKNGNLELATHPGPPHIAALQRRTLKQIGLWLEINGDAIYGTRPWFDGAPQDTTAEGIAVRYTTKPDALYAILLDWPHTQATFSRLKAGEGTTVRMLGVRAPIRWEQTGDGLVLHRPTGSFHSGDETEIPGDHAFCYEIKPRPAWEE